MPKNQNSDDIVYLSRDVRAILVPDGIGLELKKGDEVCIMQILGGMFTVDTPEGYLARIDGKDADALGKEVPAEYRQLQLAIEEGKNLSELVEIQLKSIFDPEIPVNIFDLGLIYKKTVVPVEGHQFRIDVEMTLTAPGCGMGEVLTSDVESKLLEIPNVKEVLVELVFDPPWSREMMTEGARLQLGML